MKKRLQNWITTSVGAILMVIALTMYVLSKFYEFEVTTIELSLIAVLGWVFLTARDTLLEGLFLTIFKVKKEDIKKKK